MPVGAMSVNGLLTIKIIPQLQHNENVTSLYLLLFGF